MSYTPRNKLDIENIVGSSIRSMIKHSAKIVVVMLLVIGGFVSFGASLKIDIFSGSFGFLSIFTIIATMLAYVFWADNGKQNGIETEEFKKAAKQYLESKKNINSATLKKYLLFEQERRKQYFEDVITEITGLAKEEIYLKTLIEIKKLKLNLKTYCQIKKCKKKKYPKIAYKTAEELLSVDTFNSGKRAREVKPNASIFFSRMLLSKKLFQAVIFAAFGLSMAFAFDGSDIIGSIIRWLMIVLSIFMGIAGGYKDGFKSMASVHIAALNTAISYIAECEEFAKETNLPFRTVTPSIEHALIEKAVEEIINKKYEVAGEGEETKAEQGRE